ncbi:MAG TPA: VCBS repeat-containing protein, partial [Stellaceae bacterium]|nr:VCBS repeat-containing protein [Stellaceae bacterium]
MGRSTLSRLRRGAVLVAAAGIAFLAGRHFAPRGLSAGGAGGIEPVLVDVGGVRMTLPGYRHFVIDPNPASNNTLEKALVDIDGDGRLDAVLGEGLGGGLYWYRAPASGNPADPWTKHKIAAGSFYEDIAVADVNGDGAPDLIASANDQLVWFENPRGRGGNPATDPWPMHVIRKSGGAHVIRLADIDGDGKMDIVVSSSEVLGSTSAILFQNNPDSWTEVEFGRLGEGLALIDIGSGLGRVDIAGGGGDSVVWFENPREEGGDARTGTWTEHVIASLPYAEGDSFAGGVFSAGGRMDLIVAANENIPV